MQVFATGVRTVVNGSTVPNAVSRAGRGIFAASQPLDTNVKNIRKDTRFDLPFTRDFT